MGIKRVKTINRMLDEFAHSAIHIAIRFFLRHGEKERETLIYISDWKVYFKVEKYNIIIKIEDNETV